MKKTLIAASALVMAAGIAGPAVCEARAARLGYAIPNGWAPSRGNRSHTKPSAASKTAKGRAKAKAAAKSRRQQRRR